MSARTALVLAAIAGALSLALAPHANGAEAALVVSWLAFLALACAPLAGFFIADRLFAIADWVMGGRDK